MGIVEVLVSLIFLIAIWGVNRVRKIIVFLKKIDNMLSENLPSPTDY